MINKAIPDKTVTIIKDMTGTPRIIIKPVVNNITAEKSLIYGIQNLDSHIS